jgi:ParB family transcriptional regulator, chromosome partitioning protein
MTAITTTTLSPADVIVDSNIRREVKTDKPFWASIKQDGVLQPILVELRDGKHHLIDGQRRLLAALDAPLAEIPANVIDPAKDPAGHVVRQLVVNEHREQLTDADRTAAYQTLFDLGVTADQIARRTKAPKKTVETALAVGASSFADQVAEQRITLDVAARLLEFDDEPEVVATLTEVATEQPARLHHEIEAARERRQSAALLEQGRAECAEQGLTVVDSEVLRYGYSGPMEVVRRLSATKEDAARYKDLEAEQHHDCPGRAVALHVGRNWRADNQLELEVHEVCTDWKEHGHFKQGGSASTAGPLTDEEKARRKEARENNKAWSTATTVRVAFVQGLLLEKEPPAGWQLLVGQFLARGGVEDYRIRSTVEKLLGTGSLTRVQWLEKNPTRATQMCIAHAIAAIEGQYEYEKKGWSNALTPEYLKWLSGWGYGLSEIEERIATTPKK